MPTGWKLLFRYFSKKCDNTNVDDKDQIKILFVCMGNICRSPTAQGVFQALVDQHGLGDRIRVDSAGTHSYHIGHAPDLRSQAMARSRGVELSKLRSRQFEAADFAEFDFVIAMDQSNYNNLESLKWNDSRARLSLMLEFSDRYNEIEVPDPYYGDDGFDLVFDMISDASTGLLKTIKREYAL